MLAREDKVLLAGGCEKKHVCVDTKKTAGHHVLPFAALSGKRGIRTPGTVARSPHFECGPIDHSGIFPCSVVPREPRKRWFWDCKYRTYFLFPHRFVRKFLPCVEKKRLRAAFSGHFTNYSYLCKVRTPACRAQYFRLRTVYCTDDTKTGTVFVWIKRANANQCAL